LWISTNQVTPIASGTILAASTSDSFGIKWVSITPITLTPGNGYAIGIDETSGGDTWNDHFAYSLQPQIIDTWTASGTTGGFPVQTFPQNQMYDTPALTFTTAIPDTGISRLAADSLAIGNSTPGDFSGSLKLTNVTVASLGSGTSPVCPNGSGGALTTSGCTSGTGTVYPHSAAFQIGIQRGSNLAPAFASNYTNTGSCTESSGAMTCTGSGTFAPTTALAIVSGQTYQVDAVVNTYSSGTMTASVGGVSSPAVTPAATNQYRFYFTATATTNLSFSVTGTVAFSSVTLKRAAYDPTTLANFSAVIDTNAGLSTPLTVYQPIATAGWTFQEYVIATQAVVVKTANGTDTWEWGTSTYTNTLTFANVRQTFLTQVCYVTGYWDISGLNGSITPA
jgi:hypothetical protein